MAGVASRIAVRLARLWRDERGVSAIEYGLIASLIALMSVQALTDVGRAMSNSFARSANEVGGAELAEPAPAAGEPAPADFGGTSGGGSGGASGGFAPDVPADAGGASSGGAGGGGGGGGNGGGAPEPPMSAMRVTEI